jgi:hypothetical protein
MSQAMFDTFDALMKEGKYWEAEALANKEAMKHSENRLNREIWSKFGDDAYKKAISPPEPITRIVQNQ